MRGRDTRDLLDRWRFAIAIVDVLVDAVVLVLVVFVFVFIFVVVWNEMRRERGRGRGTPDAVGLFVPHSSSRDAMPQARNPQHELHQWIIDCPLWLWRLVRSILID